MYVLLVNNTKMYLIPNYYYIFFFLTSYSFVNKNIISRFFLNRTKKKIQVIKKLQICNKFICYDSPYFIKNIIFTYSTTIIQ